jgi:hypothetical protein
VRGGAALAAAIGRHLADVRIERSGTGPFANVLVSARRPVASAPTLDLPPLPSIGTANGPANG